MIIPSKGNSQVIFNGGSVIISNDALSAIFQHAEVELNEVNEPQIAGVTDADIKDDSQPVTFEDVKEDYHTNEATEATYREPVTIDGEVESSYVNQD